MEDLRGELLFPAHMAKKQAKKFGWQLPYY